MMRMIPPDTYYSNAIVSNLSPSHSVPNPQTYIGLNTLMHIDTKQQIETCRSPGLGNKDPEREKACTILFPRARKSTYNIIHCSS
jgi:hypothetical protein